MFLRWLTYVAPLMFAQGYGIPQGISRNKWSSDVIPCQYGWYYFKATEKCYRIGDTYLTWPEAEKKCTEFGGNLATIETREENDFLVALILLEKGINTWIGLNDRSNESVYQWQNGSTSEYRNWSEDQYLFTDTEYEDCVEIIIYFVGDNVGTWNDRDCEDLHGYICEKNSDSALTSPDLRYCSHNQGGGFRYGSSCYHPVAQMKTWEEAEQHCIEQYGGHLITVLDKRLDYFLTSLLMGNNSDVWIGIKIQEQNQQMWSSGWYVGYEPFSKGTGYLYGTCVVRTKQDKWNIVSCSRKYAFVCEKSHDKIPVLKSPVKDSYCPSKPEDWRDLGGEFCYFIETGKEYSWLEANFECLRRDGNLASIHSKEEVDILWPFTKGYDTFIGLFRKEDNTFGWTDGSRLDFLNWYPGQPKNLNGNCVQALYTGMEFDGIGCTIKFSRAYICAVKKITPNITVTTTEKPEFTTSVTPNITVTTAEKQEFTTSGNIYKNILIGVIVCSVLLIILVSVVNYYFCRKTTENKKNSTAVFFQPSVPAVPPRKNRSSSITLDEDDYHYEYLDK